MGNEGPPLETLMHRLSECPAEFLAEPRVGSQGTVHVAAVVADLLHDMGGAAFSASDARAFERIANRQDRNRLRLALVACWLLHDPWFREQQRFGEPARRFLLETLPELAKLVPAPKFVSDPDRREELARLSLQALELRPAGESAAQAQDRLATLNSVERQRVIRESQEAERRAQEIREAIAREEAEAAAARYGRE